jgi:hypothetical protein
MFAAMTKLIGKLLAGMRESPGGIRFSDAMKVAEHFFGAPRKSGSHRVFRMPWLGDPRINLQEDQGGKAKAYQIRQLILAIDKLETMKSGDDKAENGEKDA